MSRTFKDTKYDRRDGEYVGDILMEEHPDWFRKSRLV